MVYFVCKECGKFIDDGDVIGCVCLDCIDSNADSKTNNNDNDKEQT